MSDVNPRWTAGRPMRTPTLIRFACALSGHPWSYWSQYGDLWWHRECPCRSRLETTKPGLDPETDPRAIGVRW